MKNVIEIQSISSIRRKVITLANSIQVNDHEITRSQAMRTAWQFVKNENCELIVFAKVSGKKCQRVVFSDWLAYNEIKGTGRPTPPNMKLFVDCAKWMLGKPNTISCYVDSIIEKI